MWIQFHFNILQVLNKHLIWHLGKSFWRIVQKVILLTNRTQQILLQSRQIGSIILKTLHCSFMGRLSIRVSYQIQIMIWEGSLIKSLFKNISLTLQDHWTCIPMKQQSYQ
nr:hypothetical protein Iba_chr04eCG3590 [Ipomoea batatas]